MSRTVQRLRPYVSTIFAEMTELAIAHEAINLGQGFPDIDGPPAMLAAARQAIADGLNQYPPGKGMPILREAISRDRLTRYGTAYDPDGEVLVTVGASEAISAAIVGLVEPGEEVVLIEPYFDLYAAAVAIAGGVRRSVPLIPDGTGYVVDHDRLRAAINSKTRVLLINSPHNPTGTVLHADDLAEIAALAIEHDLIVVADEVYEHLTFDAVAHTSVSTLPGMRERTIVVSSAAKTFAVTGWKTGWALAPAELIEAVRAAKQWFTFVAGGPFQPAVAYALDHEQDWVAAQRADLQARRDKLSNALTDTGFDVKRSEGSYYVCADVAADGLAFCRALPATAGVAAVPVSVFTDHPGPWESLVRFTFCKKDATLDEAIRRLRAWRDRSPV